MKRCGYVKAIGIRFIDRRQEVISEVNKRKMHFKILAHKSMLIVRL